MLYPAIDPIIVSLGPLAIRWYGLAYLCGFASAWWLGQRRALPRGWLPDEVSDLIFYGAMGAVLGGRIGYMIFYGWAGLVEDPLRLLRIWEGGMSFHGGLLGAGAAMLLFCWRSKRHFLDVTDFVAPLVPLGLGFGRLGNFANTELPGRVTDVSWGMQFPCSAVAEFNQTCLTAYEPVMRHPSSLYQALTEGLVLFVVLYWFSSRQRPRAVVTGLFLFLYALLRGFTEQFREPDAHLGLLNLGLSMGQWLSIPMALAGIVLVLWGVRSGTMAPLLHSASELASDPESNQESDQAEKASSQHKAGKSNRRKGRKKNSKR